MSTVENGTENASSRLRPRGGRGRGGRGRGRFGRGRGGRGGRGRGRSTSRPRSSEERPQRPESKPLPEGIVGTKVVGIINSIVRRGRARFGFILIGENSELDSDAPKVYFDFNHLTDSSVTLRRGYVVSFTPVKDDQDRVHAEDIELTESGKKIAEVKEAEIAKRKEEDPDYGKRPYQRNFQKKPLVDKTVTLKVTCDGKKDEKTVQFNLTESIGELKRTLIEAFGSSPDFNLFFVIDENTKKPLNKRFLLKLEDGTIGKVFLGPKTKD